MHSPVSPKLRIEISKNCSGILYNKNLIELIKNKDYYVESFPLDGDAPKQFIKVYSYKEDSGIKRINRKSWVPYIAKTAEKWYPHESVVEYMINKLGDQLGLTMNEVRLAYMNGQIRFLSRYFLKKNESLIHGAEICGEFLDDMPLAKQIADEKNTARQLFTFEFICKALESIFPKYHENLIFELVRMLTYDALIGNNDRHFYNWGIITTSKVSNQIPRFAPLYDSARGLLWNVSDENVVNWHKMQKTNGQKVVKYINLACPRISVEANNDIDHFGLMTFLKNYNSLFKKTINDLSSFNQEEKILSILEKDFYPFFIKERQELISYIIKERFKKIRGI